MPHQKNRDSGELSPSEITTRATYDGRRQLLKHLAAGTAGTALAAWAGRTALAATPRPGKLAALASVQSTVPGANTFERPTSYADITSYNNFYEFGTGKGDPEQNAHTLNTRPWTVSVEGLVKKPKVFDIDELLKLSPMEDRIYRLRCVEGWSMVIPWVGYSLVQLIKRVEPTSDAKYVQFVTLDDPKTMPYVSSSQVLQWPYVEGLRMDEAMHPLTLLTFGLYGEVLPNQDGAPIRIIVPWKYGFKSGKSIVKIVFTDQQPITSWNRSAPQEYGFYSNVNPTVDHPRWSQATERRIGEDGIFSKKRPTLMFNGYGTEVASLYSGMDLKKFF